VNRNTDFDGYAARAAAGGMVPVVRELAADMLTPVGAYAAIAQPPFSFLLESLVGGERWARYTFLGTEPREAWRYRAGQADRWTPAEGWTSQGPAPDPLDHLGKRLRGLKAAPARELPRFTGGGVGYLGYDVVRGLERLPGGPRDDLDLPDAVFMLADALVIIDNAFGRAAILVNTDVAPGGDRAALVRAYDGAVARIEDLHRRLSQPPHLRPLSLADPAPLPTDTPYPRAAFERDVERIKEYIRAGDTFQTVLSRRQDLDLAADPLDVYRALRTLNPAPYLYFLRLDDLVLAGSSPEVLVRVEDREMVVRPIAGTRPRGATPEEDERLTAELLADPKELAEHMMLVDLGRNDVGRAAQYGTVRVTELKTIERYSHVQHIVSEVRGRLRPELDAVDVLRGCFPAGTVTGAPKVRAMEIIDELEPTRRGPYAGAVGYIGWGAETLDTAIALRTAILRGGRAHVQAGAGIVADSDPAREFEETESKAGAVLKALAIASRR
jgi:anthranilate synthase component 1